VANCTNHPGVATEATCQRCRYPYCSDCLVQLTGRLLCAPCRDHVVREMQHGFETNDRGARDALIWACVGMLCGVIAPFGLIRGIRALRQLDPSQKGPRGMAIAAIVIGGLISLLLVIQLVVLIIPALLPQGGR
jgi:hypothetical protein